MYWHLLWAAVFEWRYWFYSFLMVSSHCITKYRRTDFDSAWICFLHSSTALLCTAKSTYLPHENRIWSVFGSLIALFGTSTAVHYPTAVCSLTSLPVRPPPKVVSQSCLLYKMWFKNPVQHVWFSTTLIYSLLLAAVDSIRAKDVAQSDPSNIQLSFHFHPEKQKNKSSEKDTWILPWIHA